MAHQRNSKAEQNISVDTLRELVEYDPRTGTLTWKVRDMRHGNSHGVKVFNSVFAGMPALTGNDGDGYLHGTILGFFVRTHRVAWALHHGSWPDGDIDHIDGDRSNNRIENLRVVTRAENARNRARNSRNTSGCTGVCWLKRAKRWLAFIKRDGRMRHLGLFKEYEDAVRARKEAEVELEFHPNHDRPQVGHLLGWDYKERLGI